MSANASRNKSGTFLTLLFFLFLGLKLSHVVAWSWWVIFIPFYPAALLLGVGLLLIAVAVAVKTVL